MSKYVQNYRIELLPNGVYQLTINLKQKGCYHHRIYDNLFLITGTEEEYDNHDPNCILSIEEFLPKNKEVIYAIADNLNKDQLIYYYIPFYREWIKNKSVTLIQQG